MTSESHDPLEVAVIVHEKPLAGSFEEILFGSDRGNTLWVKFSDKNDIVEWIGKFGCGLSSHMRVTTAVSPDKFLVVAGGFAYLVDATNKKVLQRFLDEHMRDYVYDPKRNLLVVADDVRIRVVNSEQVVWVSPRIAMDGIRNLSLEGDIVRGMAVTDYTYGHEHLVENEFTIDLETKKATCAIDLSGWDRPLPSHAASKKMKWWERLWRL